MRSDGAVDNKQYLGDGVYAQTENGMIALECVREGRRQIVYLEPEVWKALIYWAEKAWQPS